MTVYQHECDSAVSQHANIQPYRVAKSVIIAFIQQFEGMSV